MNWRDKFDKDLEEEMQFHLDQSKQEHQAKGLPENEAKQAAKRAFGNQTSLHERTWQATGYAPIERIAQDLKYAARSCKRNPGFSFSVVLLLGLAIWMCTTCFTVIQAVMLAPLPFQNADQLVRISETSTRHGTMPSAAPANFTDWKATSQSFSAMAAARLMGASLDDDTDFVMVAAVTHDFFPLFQVRPMLGRSFAADEFPPVSEKTWDLTSGVNTAVISHGLWQRHYGGKRSAIGSTMRIKAMGTPATVRIIGVMPAGFSAVHTSVGGSGLPLDVWIPTEPENERQQDNRMLTVIARRKDGVSLAQAQAEMDVLSAQLQSKRPKSNEGWSARVKDLREVVVGSYALPMWIMACSVILVLLIACANVGNLILARGATRLREMATRKAMGAGSGRLIAQLTTETLMLSLCAGLLGFVLSLSSVRALVAFAPPEMPRIAEASVNLTVFGFCLLVALATGLLCSLAPALRVAKLDLNTTLKDGGTISATAAGGLLSRGLVIVEIAASLVLLVGAALLARGFTKSQMIPLGFEPQQVLTVGLQPDTARFRNAKGNLVVSNTTLHAHDELISRLKVLPGVVSIGTGQLPPRTYSMIDCRTETDPRPIPCASSSYGGDFLNVMRIPLLKGRLFHASDDASTVIINETAARMLWPSQDAIGRRIGIGPRKDYWLTVVGVVGDVPNAGLREPVRPHVYRPESGFIAGDLFLRTSGNPSKLSNAVRETVRSDSSGARIRSIATMEQILAKETAPLRFNTLIMTAFAILAFVLAASGVYSLMSYTVSLRMREVSIRMALGATRNQIIAMIVRSGALLTTIGIALGIAGAFGTTHFLASMLFKVTPLDPASFAAATTLLIAAALTACYIPARRAATADVVEILRQD